MNFLQTGKFFWRKWFYELMDQPPKIAILLWWPSHNSKMPDWIFTVINIFYFQYRKIMFQAVISKVIAKRSFRFHFIHPYHTCDAKISISRKHKSIMPEISESTSCKHSRKSDFA